jgi:phytoene dehydrogenase-like protein
MNAFRTMDERDSYKVPQQPRRAIIIGSGFGGLAAAIRLSVKGYQVQVYEKLDMAGGRAYVH